MSSSPVVSKAMAKAATANGGPSPTRVILIAVACVAGVFLAVAGGLSLWSMAPGGLPRLNADTISLAKFVSSEEYTKLAFDKQQLYMKVLEDREDNNELKKAFNSGRLTESEYRTALQEAWLGQQIKRSEKYVSLPPGQLRAKYISDLLDRKEKNKAKEAKESKSNAPKSNAEEIKRDDTLEKMRIASWPAEVRLRWEEYRKAYDTQKEAREKPEGTAATDNSK